MPLDSSPLALDSVAPPAAAGPSGNARGGPVRPGGMKRTHSLTIPTPPQTERKKAKIRHGHGVKARVVRGPNGEDGPAGRLLFHPKESGPVTKKAKARAGAPVAPIVLPFPDPFARGFKTPSPPSTPRTPKAAEPALPARDEEANPFVVSKEEEERMKASRAAYKLNAPKPVPIEEQATVTYVFRGVRQTFTNPLFGRPTVTEASRLPVSHPDYSPPPNIAPRLLFPPGTTKESVEREWSRNAGDKLRTRVENIESTSAMDVDMDDADDTGHRVPFVAGRVGSENAPMRVARGIR